MMKHRFEFKIIINFNLVLLLHNNNDDQITFSSLFNTFFFSKFLITNLMQQQQKKEFLSFFSIGIFKMKNYNNEFKLCKQCFIFL